MGNFLIWLSGAQPALLRRCPTDHGKYLGIGSAILLTAAVASTSMTFALTTALKAALPIALLFALGWGLAIMSLDRWLVVSLQRQDSAWRYLLLALTRLLLALLIGFIVSTPFVLQIFRPEIENKLVAIRSERATAFAANPPLAGTIVGDNANVNRLENLITTGGKVPNPFQDPRVAGLVTQRNRASAQEKHYLGEWNCQLYGGNFDGTHCHRGNGQVARVDQKAYLKYQAQVQGLTTNINKLTTAITATEDNGIAKRINASKVDLFHATQKLHTDETTQRTLTAAFVGTNGKNGGLLIRLQALGQLTSGDGTLNAARWLLFALFTTIECLPILVKTLLNFGPENAYEKVLAGEEQMWLRIAAETTERRQAAGTIEADSILDEAQQLAANREPMIQDISQQAIAAEREVAIAWIRSWKVRQLHDIGKESPGRRPAMAWIGGNSHGTSPGADAQTPGSSPADDPFTSYDPEPPIAENGSDNGPFTGYGAGGPTSGNGASGDPFAEYGAETPSPGNDIGDPWSAPDPSSDEEPPPQEIPI